MQLPNSSRKRSHHEAGTLHDQPCGHDSMNAKFAGKHCDEGRYKHGYCNIETAKNLSTEFTNRNPVASPQKYNTKLVGFAYGKEDAKKLCEFILISLEAEKNDVMKTFNYKIDYQSLEVLGIPFYKIGNGRYKDAVLGLEI